MDPVDPDSDPEHCLLLTLTYLIVIQGASGAEQTDLNLLYWSEETGTVDISALEGRCYVR